VGVEKRPQFGHKIGDLCGIQSAAKRPNLDVAEVEKERRYRNRVNMGEE